MTKPVYCDLTVVVNGLPTIVRVRKTDCLHNLRKRALIQTNNAGQPPENWEIRDAMGRLLNLEATPEELALPNNTTLFLNLHAGIGGSKESNGNHCGGCQLYDVYSDDWGTCGRLEILVRATNAGCDAMAIARDEAQIEAINMRRALANIVLAAAESKPFCSTHASIPNAFIDAASAVLSTRGPALQYAISDLEVENGELRDKIERLCTLFREEWDREYSESDITDILERCMAGERM